MVINLGYIVIGLYHGDLKDGPLIKRSMIVTQYEGPFVVLWRALYREWFKAPFEKTYIALAMTWIFMSPISWLRFLLLLLLLLLLYFYGLTGWGNAPTSHTEHPRTICMNVWGVIRCVKPAGNLKHRNFLGLAK